MLASSALTTCKSNGHITAEQLALLTDEVAAMELPAAFIVRMMAEGLKGPPLAEALGDTLDWPVYDPIESKSVLKTDRYILSESRICFVVNPLDYLGLSAIAQELNGAQVEGWGVIPLEILQDAEGKSYTYFSNPDQNKQLIFNLVSTAYASGSSDIHFFPRGKEVAIRMRIDGALRNHQIISIDDYPDLAGSIMTACELNTGEYIRPFDGRLVIELSEHTRIPVRMAGIECVTASKKHPKFTLRLLASKHELATLESLGFSKSSRNPQFRQMTEAFRKPYGLIIVTGPTGSGKSTSLFAAMRWMIAKRPTDAFYTLEDPVEAELQGATQIQCFSNPSEGPTFATGLRNLLRQDPNTILVGEIRDTETAELSVKASITGHRVLSTLHANTACGAAARLRDMGVDPSLMSDALTLVSAQRIVPKVCPHCSKHYRWDELVSDPNHEAFKGHPEDTAERFAEAHARYRKLGTYPSDDAKVVLPSPVGCDRCTKRGVKGRALVAEVLEMTPAIKSLVAQPHTSEADIIRTALAEGFKPMWEHAMELVSSGVISLVHAEDELGPMPFLPEEETLATSPTATQSSEDLPVPDLRSHRTVLSANGVST